MKAKRAFVGPTYHEHDMHGARSVSRYSRFLKPQRPISARRLDALSLRSFRLPRLRRGSFAPWLRPLVALTLRSLRLTALSCRRFAALWPRTLALRSFRLPPLGCGRVTLRLLAPWPGSPALPARPVPAAA